MNAAIVRLGAACVALVIPAVVLAAPPQQQRRPPPQQQQQRQAPQQQRQIPQQQQQQQRQVQRPATPIHTALPQGFNLNHDIRVRQPVVAQPPPETTQQGPAGSKGRPPSADRRAAPNVKRAPFTTSARGPYQNHPHGPPLQNPHHYGNWQWNRGVAWAPVQTYWGGGFWGPFALGALASAALFGSIIDVQDQLSYPSYQVMADSPGAVLLQNYGLQQTPCGPDNLVVIWGPDNSVICAYPNDLVGPGNYDLDPATLTLVSESP